MRRPGDDPSGVGGQHVALVTAAANGIGAATALAMSHRGYRVVVSDIDANGLRRTVADVADHPGGQASVAVVADVTTEVGAAAAVAAAIDAFGQLDVLVNVVGGSRPGSTVLDLDLVEWDRWMAMNLSSVFVMSKYALPHLQDTRGSIVNVSSGAGIRGMRGNPAYCAAKAGVIGLTRAMAIDHGPDGVRINCVAPGPVRTPLMVRNRTEDEIAQMGALSVLGRIGEPAEIANAIVWLAGDAASYVQGQTIEVDGGPAPIL